MIEGNLKPNTIIRGQNNNEIRIYKIPDLYEKIRRNFVALLRSYFSSDFIEDNLKYNKEKNLSKLAIYSAFPKKQEFFPCIIFTIERGNISFKYLQDEFIGVTPDNYDLIYNGGLEFDLNFGIYSRSMVEKDKLIDHMIFLLRNIMVYGIRGIDLFYKHNISLSEGSPIIVNEEPIFNATISMPVYTEYKVDRELNSSLIQEIILNKINIFMEDNYE